MMHDNRKICSTLIVYISQTKIQVFLNHNLLTQITVTLLVVISFLNVSLVLKVDFIQNYFYQLQILIDKLIIVI